MALHLRLCLPAHRIVLRWNLFSAVGGAVFRRSSTRATLSSSARSRQRKVDMSSSNNFNCWRHLYYATVLLLLAAASWTSEAFIIVAPAATTKKNMMRSSSLRPTVADNTNDDKSNQSTTTTKKKLTHADITWKLRPPENTSKLARLKTKFGANVLRLYSKLKGKTLPPVLCPKGGRAMLEAYYREPGGLLKRRRMIGRFGFTTSRGPSNTESELFCFD